MLHVDNSIRITHFINPHHFYYKSETAFMQEHEQTKFAEAFNEHCETAYGMIYEMVRKTPAWKHPKPGDLVALRSNQLQRWIRCEMEEVLVDVNETTWYYLWAIDEGFPIKSHTTYVRPLPQAYGQEPAHAKRGAIENLLPGKSAYDYVEAKQIVVPSSKWSCGVASTLECILNAAENISFYPTTRHVLQNETINVGELFITGQTNATHTVVETLLEACPNQMIVTQQTATYLKGIEALGAFSKPRYVNNEGFDNHIVNIFVTNTIHQRYDTSCHAYMDTQTDPTVATKVYEWFRQNRQVRIATLEKEKANKEAKKEKPAHTSPKMDTQTDTTGTMKVYGWFRKTQKARIAIQEQEKADKDRMEKQAIQQTSKPARKVVGSASVLRMYLERAKFEIDEKDRKTISTDLAFPTHDESGDVLHSKPSSLVQKIKRLQARLEVTHTVDKGSSSTATA